MPVSLAILAGLIYLIRRRPAAPDEQDGISAYLDNKGELDVNGKLVHTATEVAGGSRTMELSGQNLVELQHPTSP